MNLITRRGGKLTELWKELVAPLVQDVDDLGDVGVGTVDESVGGDSSG